MILIDTESTEHSLGYSEGIGPLLTSVIFLSEKRLTYKRV